jgi:uncharacterized phage protein gp47/JayE
MAGLTPAGLTIKRLADILEEMKTLAQSPSYFGPGVAVDDDTPLGHILGLFAVQLAKVWELSQQVYDSRDPNSADGTSLDNVSSLVGVDRLDATKTFGDVVVDGVLGTFIPTGSIVRIPDGERFITTEDVTLTAGTDLVNVEAENTGAIEAAIGSVTEIVTAIAGWASVNNTTALATGREIETDYALRNRRQADLQVIGAGIDQAIKARVEDNVEAVTAARVISNRSTVTDSRGIPPHAFLTVVYPSPLPDETEVIQAIYDTMPAGILPHGVVNYQVTDENGYQQTVGFSYALAVDIYMTATLTYSSEYDGDTAVEDAILEHAELLSVGDDVSLLSFLCAIPDSVAGIVTLVITAKIGSPPGPGDDQDIPIDLTEYASFSAARTAIVSTPA